MGYKVAVGCLEISRSVKVTRMGNAVGRGGQIPRAIQSVDRRGNNSFILA